MRENLFGVDFDGSIKDFDYTRGAMHQVYEAITSEEFIDRNVEVIRNTIEALKHIAFSNQLKRYIFKKAGLPGQLQDVPNDTFSKIIISSFDEHCVDYSIKPTTRRKKVIVNSWLTQDRVQRETIFLLGFGLGMSENDVSEFLVKGLKEKSFNFHSPEETAYWYCFHNALPMQRAKKLLSLSDEAGSVSSLSSCQSAEEASKVLTGDNAVVEYLRMLKADDGISVAEKKTLDTFVALVNRAKECIAKMYQETEDWEDTGKVITADQLTMLISRKTSIPAFRSPKTATCRR